MLCVQLVYPFELVVVLEGGTAVHGSASSSLTSPVNCPQLSKAHEQAVEEASWKYASCPTVCPTCRLQLAVAECSLPVVDGKR